MGEIDSSIKEVASWKSVEDGTVVKTIDSTFQQSGESVVPMEFIDFFAATDMKKGDSRKIVWIYNEQEYEGFLAKTNLGGQIKISVADILLEELRKDPYYTKNAGLQISWLDENEYELNVIPAEQEELDRESNTGVSNLKYNGVDPIYKSINVGKKDFSIFELSRRFKKGTLIVDVDFQRRNVWKSKQKCELVESVLMGLPLPVFYFKQKEDASYVVVDGKQRLSALFDYMDDKFKLRGLKVLSFLNGKKFSQLTEEYAIYQTQLEDYQVYTHVIFPPTPDAILFDIFDRVNRGGTLLNKMEIRNALYHGKGLDMLMEIAATEEFKNATSIEHKKDIRMKGVYMLTRSVSFNLLLEGKLSNVVKDRKIYEFKGDVDELQGVALDYLNAMPKEELEKYREEILENLRTSYRILGSNGFRKGFDSTKPINMNMFETLMYFWMKLQERNVRYSDQELNRRIGETISSKRYLAVIGNRQDSYDKIKERFEVMDDLLEEVCI